MATNRLVVDSNYFGRQFSADSMDRFGDDMTELIVGYLGDEDKHSLECVSKQWQGLIYNRMTSLHIYGKDRQFKRKPLHWALFSIDTEEDCNRVKAFLKKCPNVRIIIDGVQHMPTIIEVMADNCHRLRSLSLIDCNIPLKAMTLFGQSLGPQLKYLELSSDEKYYQTLLELCPNLKSLVCDQFSIFSNRRSDFLPKLKSLETNIDHKNVTLLADIGLKYGKQLKFLCLTTDNRYINKISSHQIIEVLRCIPMFEVIIELELNFREIEDHSINIDKELTEIGFKCRRLRKLLIEIDYLVIDGNVWKSFANFTELNELKLSFEITNIDQSIKDIGLKTYLKRLIVCLLSVNERMFEDINRFVPNLESIDIETGQYLSDTLLKSLSGLKHLKDLYFCENIDGKANVTDSGVSQLLDNCPELKRIDFWGLSLRNITNKTIENLISFANKRPKQVIGFFAFDYYNESDNNIDINQFDSIPANLKIEIKDHN